MADDEPDDRIIRERQFKRSSGVEITDFEFEEREDKEIIVPAGDEAIGEIFDPFSEHGSNSPGAVLPDGTVVTAPERDLVTELSIEGERRVNWIIMVSMVLVYSAISIQVGTTFNPFQGTIALLILGSFGLLLGELWIPKEKMVLLGVTWVIISMKVLYGLAIELRQWNVITSDWGLGLALVLLVGVNVYAAYRHDQDAIAAQSTLVLLAIGSTAGSVLGEEGVAGMILLSTILLHGLALNRDSGNLASLGIAASNLWIGMHAVTSGFEIGHLRVLPLDSPLLLFLLLMVVTGLNATMAARFARKENWFSKGFETVGLGKPGLWGVSISLGMVGAIMAVAANRDELGYALGMVTFLGGAFGGSYLVVRGVERNRVIKPLIISASLLSLVLLAEQNVEETFEFTSYQIFTVIGASTTGFVILRDQSRVSDRVLWSGSVAILVMLVLLVPTESSEVGGDGGAILLSLLSALHIGTAALALKRDSASLSGVTVLLPWSWILIEEVIQEAFRTVMLANDISDPGGIIDLDPNPLALYLGLSIVLLFVVNTKMGESGVNLASGFLGISEISASIRDSGALQLWSLGLWLPMVTILFLAQFGGFTSVSICIILALLACVHVVAHVLEFRSGSSSSIMGFLALATVIVQWRHGIDEVMMGILCISISTLLFFDENDEGRFSLSMILMTLPLLVLLTDRDPTLVLAKSESMPNPGEGLASVLCTLILLGVYLPRAEKMEKLLKPASASLTLLVVTIWHSINVGDDFLIGSSVAMFLVTSVWLIARGELRSELRSIAKRDSIIELAANSPEGSVVSLDRGAVETYNAKLTEMIALRRKSREKSESGDIGDLLTSDVSHRPVVGLTVLAVVMASTIVFGAMNGSNRGIWPLFLIVSGAFSALIVFLVRSRTRGLELELPHFLGIEMPIALSIGGLVLAVISAHVIGVGVSNTELLDLAVVSVLITLMVLISLLHYDNLLERISIAIDWLVFALLTARLLGALIGEALPMPLSVNPFEGDSLEWRGPLFLLESMLFFCVLGGFWVEEKRKGVGREGDQGGLGIGLRTLAIVMLSFGPAGIVAVLSASYRSLVTKQPLGLGIALPGGVLALMAVSSWNGKIGAELPMFVLILGLVLMIMCAFTVPLNEGVWTMTLVSDGHLFVISGALAMGLIDDVLMPILLMLMSTTIWVVGILQLRKALRIWGLIDLVTAIVCGAVFVSSELTQPTNLLVSLVVLALELGLVAWLGLANQEEMVRD